MRVEYQSCIRRISVVVEKKEVFFIFHKQVSKIFGACGAEIKRFSGFSVKKIGACGADYKILHFVIPHGAGDENAVPNRLNSTIEG